MSGTANEIRTAHTPGPWEARGDVVARPHPLPDAPEAHYQVAVVTSRGGRVSEAGIQHFRRVHDDVYAVHEWPDYLFVSTELIAQAQGDGNLIVGEGVIEFKVANGGATYKVVRMSDRIWDCTLIEGTFREFEPSVTRTRQRRPRGLLNEGLLER